MNISDLAAAIGKIESNVVRFVPPPPRDEPQAANPEIIQSLDLIDQAADFFRATEQRATAAEERAEKVAAKAIEGLRSAQSRVDAAEEHARAVEEQANEDIRLANTRLTEAESWAQRAEERARDAETRLESAEARLEAAEARARQAEEALYQLTEALRQKLSFGAAAQTIENHLLRRSA